MENKMIKVPSKVTSTISVLFLLVTLSGCSWWSDNKEKLLKDDLTAEYYSVQATKAALLHTASGNTSLMSAFVAKDIIQDQLNLLRNTEITPKKPIKDFEDAFIKINKVTLDPQDGAAKINIKAVASSPKNSLSINFDIKGVLVYRGHDASDGKLRSIFGIELTYIKPDIEWHKIVFISNKLVSDALQVAGYDMIEKFESNQRLEVPLHFPLAIDTGNTSTTDIPTNDKQKLPRTNEPEGLLTVQITVPSSEFKRDFFAEIPAFTKEGIWLLGGDSNAPELNKPVEEGLTPEFMKNQLVLMRADIADLKAKLPTVTNKIELRINHLVLMDMISEFGQLPADKRKINVSTVSYRGHIGKYEPRSGDLDAWAYAEFREKNPLNINATVGVPVFSFDNNIYNFSVPVSVSGNVKVHGHIDPGLGGGFGHNATVSVSAGTNASGNIKLSKSNIAGHDVFLINQKLNCSQFSITGTDNGELKVGAKTWMYIGDKNTPASLVLSDLPIDKVIDLKALNEGEAEFKLPFKQVRHTPNPKSIHYEGSIMVVGIDLTTEALANVNDVKEMIKQENERIESELQSIADNTQVTGCPGLKGSEFLIAGTKIGANNEFIKLGTNIANELDKIKTKPVQAVVDTPKNVVNEIARAGKKVEKAVRCFFGC